MINNAPLTQKKMETKIGKGWDNVKVIRNPQKIAGTEILETKHYDWFKMDVKNRPISEPRVNNFMREFKKGNFFMEDFPAVVAGDYTIIDGQHRFEAVKRLGMPFYFRVASQLTMEKVVEVQTNAGWSPADYLHAFIKQGNQNYVVLQRFITKYKMTASLAIEMIKGASENMRSTGFYTGTLIISDKQETDGHRRCKIAREILDLCPNSRIGQDTKFFRAIIRIEDQPEYSHKRMISQITKYPSLMERQVNTENYVRLLEKVFNYKAYTENKIRFI